MENPRPSNIGNELGPIRYMTLARARVSLTVYRPVIVDEFHGVTIRYLIVPISIDIGDQRWIRCEEVFGVEIEDLRDFDGLPRMIDTDVARFGEELG